MVVYLSHRKVKSTRKPHRCFGCDRVFSKKSSLTCTNQVDEGRAYSLYFCEFCWNYTENHPDIEWEEMFAGEIGFWQNDQWYPMDE